MLKEEELRSSRRTITFSVSSTRSEDILKINVGRLLATLLIISSKERMMGPRVGNTLTKQLNKNNGSVLVSNAFTKARYEQILAMLKNTSISDHIMSSANTTGTFVSTTNLEHPEG